MIIDESTKRQFVRDFKLPIQIVKDGYFEYYVDLFQEQYQSKDKFELLKETVKIVGGLEAFQEESRRVRHAAIDHIANKDIYKELSNEKLSNFSSSFKYKTNLYNHDNVGKLFISIDLVKGNFQSLKFFNPELVDNAKNYDEFLSQFTDLEYLKKSKQIRQVIFGNLLPKKQKKLQEYMMGVIKECLILSGLEEDMIKATSPDEIVFEIEDVDDFKKYEEILKQEKIAQFDIHFEVFKLEEIKEDLDCFLKVFQNKDGFEIKKGNMKYMPELIKYLKKEPLNELDLYFFDEGRIACYNEPLFYK